MSDFSGAILSMFCLFSYTFRLRTVKFFSSTRPRLSLWHWKGGISGTSRTAFLQWHGLLLRSHQRGQDLRRLHLLGPPRYTAKRDFHGPPSAAAPRCRILDENWPKRGWLRPPASMGIGPGASSLNESWLANTPNLTLHNHIYNCSPCQAKK